MEIMNYVYDYRILQPTDYDAAQVLWSTTEGVSLDSSDSFEGFSLFLKSSNLSSFGAFYNDTLIATVLCGTDGRRGFLYHLVVNSNFRRKGLATSLINLALEQFKKSGIPKCHIFVFNNNREGIQFWNNSGWAKRSDISVYSIKF